jgi:ankyrin repeat protein
VGACIAAVPVPPGAYALPAAAALAVRVAGPTTPGMTLVQIAPSAQERAAYTGLHAAAVAGNAPEIARRIEAGADLDARDDWGRTPLMVAGYAREHDAARLLIAAGADVDALDRQAYDLLTIAAVLDDLTMVELAIASGANAALVTSPYQGTALIAAAHLGHVEVVSALIAGGAPLDHVNNLGWTALIEAIVLGDGGPDHVAIVRALVEAGADVDLADGAGTRPIALARERGYAAIERILQGAGARP